MKIIFMGSPEFSVPSIDLMLKNNYMPSAVYTSTPRAAGRGMKVKMSPVHSFADSLNLEVFTPTSLKNSEEYEKIAAISPDLIVVVAYGLILPDKLLSLPKYGCVNVHPSLLPRWRGASPIQSAIMNDDETTGVSIIRLTDKLDAGPILSRKSVKMSSEENYVSLHDKLSVIGAELLLGVLNDIATGGINKIIQNDSYATYCGKIFSCEIDWNQSAHSVCCVVRALFPNAFFQHESGFLLKILSAFADKSNTKYEEPPGTFVGAGVVCGDGKLLILREVKREGKNSCSMKDFLNGLKNKKVRN